MLHVSSVCVSWKVLEEFEEVASVKCVVTGRLERPAHERDSWKNTEQVREVPQAASRVQELGASLAGGDVSLTRVGGSVQLTT